MSVLDAKALKAQTRRLPDSVAIELLEEALQKSLPQILGEMNSSYVSFREAVNDIVPVIALLGCRDPQRADSFIDRWFTNLGRRLSWIELRIQSEIYIVNLRQELEALSPDERYARLTLACLAPGGMPEDEFEQVALVLARLRDDPGSACGLAAQWWRSGWLFDSFVEDLFEACWRDHPEPLRQLIGVSLGDTRDSYIGEWMKRLSQSYSPRTADSLRQLLEMMSTLRIRWEGLPPFRAHLIKVTEDLHKWSLDERKGVLDSLLLAWGEIFAHLESSQVGAEDVIIKLFPLSTGPEWKAQLQALLERYEPMGRLRSVRKIKRAVGGQFGYRGHAAALLAHRGKKLRDYLNRKYVRPDHRRLWHGLLRGERLIQLLSDESLRQSLLAQHALIVKETKRARKGLVVTALETDTREPILVRPEKQR